MISSQIKTAIVAIFVTLSLGALAEAKLKEGADFPEFAVDVFPGSAKLDAEKIKGPVVIVDFWASWCEPCKIELPTLNGLYKKYKSRGLVVIGVNVDDDTKDAKAFLKDHSVSFPLAYDKEKKMVNSLEITTMPTSFVLSNGKIVKIHAGFRDGDEKKIEEEILPLLKSASASRKSPKKKKK